MIFLKKLICCLLVLLHFFVAAQSQETELQKKDAIDKIKTNLLKAKQLYTTNRIQGELVATEVYKSASKYSETVKEFIDVHNLLGLFNQYNDKISEAKKFYNDGLELAIKHNEKSLTEKIKTNIGNLLIHTGRYEECIQYSLTLIETLNDNLQAKANTLANIAICYAYLKNDNSAILFQQNANKLFEQLKDKRGISTGYNLLGSSYVHLKQYDSANKYLYQSLQYKTEMKDTSGIINATLNIASNYYAQNKIEEAKSVYKNLEKIIVAYNSNIHLTSFYNNIANVYDKLKMFDSAIIYNKLSFKQVQKTQHLYLQANAALNLSKAYHKINNIDSALYYRIIGDKLTDSLNAIEKNKTLLELSTKYETEAKQLKINLLLKEDSIKKLQLNNQTVQLKNQQLSLAQQNFEIAEAQLKIADDSLLLIKKNKDITTQKLQTLKKEQEINNLSNEKKLNELALSKKNNLLIAISLLLLLLILAGYLFYKQKKQQQENKMQQQLHIQQEKSMMAVLEAEEKERKRIAAELHDGIGQSMTAAWMNMQSALNSKENDEQKNIIFKNALTLIDESCKEIRVVSHNMMPNVLLQKGLVNAVKDFLTQINKQGLNINIEAEGLHKSIPPHVESVLYRVIQEAVNNVVKHANATELFITLYNDADGIDVMIEDNGVGFDKTKIKNNGIGLQNIKSRIEFLKGNVEWDTALYNGTVLSIHVPL
ncbi:MAG: hypothetical protein JST29_03325 [Bacteroidetes bacterium]|nr:hypothetical protein [Bacteroidota bacterium]